MTFKTLLYRFLLPVVVFISVTHTAFTQSFPVNTSIQLGLPNSSYFFDYTSTGSNQLTVNLLFQDFNEPSWDVRLNIVLESSDLRIQTNLNQLPSGPITIFPGSFISLKGADLFDYFDISRVLVSGISKEELSKNGKLPEGFYTFSVQALDYNSGKVISNTAIANAWLKINDEPIIITPQCEQNVKPMDVQVLPFQWQLTSAPSPDALNSIAYKLFMYELTDVNADPFTALNNGKALLVFESEELSQTTLIYDMSRPALEQGKVYIFRVQAFDVNGKDRFKNNGFSEICWFRYGYPSGGKIELKAPIEDFKFSKDDPRLFSWSMPDNLINGQEYSYTIKIIQVEGDFPVEDQMRNNPAWHTEKTITTGSRSNWEFELDKEFEEQKQYAWQVTAHSGDQEIAASEINTFFGPTLIDWFRAGQHTVWVTKIDNVDLNALSGTGKIKITNDLGDSLMTEVSFSNLEVIDAAGRYVLQAGEITHEFPDTFSVVLQPRVITENKIARFHPLKVKLDKDALEVYGYAKWPLPHPVTSSEKAYVVSESGWVNYDEYAPFGPLNLNTTNDFELLEPLGFRVELLNTSEFQLYNDKYELRLDGNIHLPKSVKGFEQSRIAFNIVRQEQLFYMTEAHTTFNDKIDLVKNTHLGLESKSLIIDFSDVKSPFKLQEVKDWKGVYFTQFEVIYPKAVDDSKQLVFESELTTPFELSAQNDFKAWVSPQGLTTYFHDDFEYGSTGTFNTFPANFTAFSVDIENNAVTDSRFIGNIKVPVVDKFNDFTFTIPMSNGGFETGYLDESLEHHSFVFSPYGGENRVDLTIQKAIFADNERLDLVLDITIPYIETEMKGVEDFRVYGDHFIGFGKRNGAKDLAEQATGTYDGFTMYIDKIGAGLQGTDYVFSYSATMPLGEEVSGENGPPRLNIASSASIGDEFAGEVNQSSAPAMEMPKPEKDGADPKTISVDSMYIAVTSEIVDLDGYLILTKNDPTWGTAMKGGIDGKIKMPAMVDFGSNMILGTKNNLKYWYFDAWFIDEAGTVIPVFNMFNIVAFEGKVYRHMRQDLEADPNSGQPNFLIDGDVEFGTALYTQLIDPQGGMRFQSDVGIELVVESDHFVVAMEGDLSLINTNTRSPSALAGLKKAAVKAAVSEVAKQIGPIELDIPLGGGKMMNVKGLPTAGTFTFNDNGSGFVLDGNINDVPKAAVKIFNPSMTIDVAGSVDGAGSFAFDDGSTSIGLAYNPGGAASLDLGFSGNTISASYNNMKKAGAFKLQVEDKLVDVGIDKTAGSGHLEIGFGTNRIYAFADKVGIAEFEVEYDNVFVGVKGNKPEQSGEIAVQVGDDYFKAALNKSLGQGSLGFSFGEVAVNVNADKSGIGELNLEIDRDQVYMMVNKPERTGQITVDIDGNRVAAGLDNEGVASFELDVDNVSLGISGNQQATAGSFRFDDGNTKIEVAADKIAATGHARVYVGDDSVKALISPELNQLQIGIDGSYFGVESDGSSKGSLSLVTNGVELGLGADNNDKSGYLDLKIGNDKLYIAGNQSEKTAAFDLDFDGVKVYAAVNPELNKLGFSFNDIAFDGEANATRGSISFNKGSDSFGVGLDKNDGSGFLNLDVSGTKLDIAANTSARTGSFLLDVEGTNINAQVSPELKSLGITTTGTSLNISTDGATKGDVALSIGETAFTMGGDKTIQSGYLSFSDAGNRFKIGANGSEKSGYVGLNLGSDSLYASITTAQQNLTWSISGQDAALITDLNAGTGSLSFSQGDVKIGIAANNPEKSGEFHLQTSDVKLDLAAGIEAQTASIDFDGEGVTASAAYATEAQSMAMAYDDFSLEINKLGASAGNISVVKGNDKVAAGMDYANKAANIRIESGNVKLLADINVTNYTGSLDVTVDNNNVNTTITEEQKSLAIQIGTTQTNSYLNTNGDLGFELTFDDYTTGFSQEGSTKTIVFGKGDFEVALNSAKLASFSFDGVAFSIDFSKGKPNILKAGQTLNYSVNNLGIGTVNFADYTDGKLQLSLEISASKSSLHFNNLITLSSEVSGPTSLSVNVDGKTATLSKATNNEVSFALGETNLKINPAGSLEFNLGSSKQIIASRDALSVNIDNYKTSISKTALSLSDGTNNFSVSKEALQLNSGEKSLAFFADKRLELALSSKQKISLSPTNMAINIDNVSLQLSSDKTLSYADGTRTVSISASEFALAQGDMGFSVNANKELNIKNGAHRIALSPESAKLISGAHELLLSAEKSITYTGSSQSFKVSTEGMSFEIDGKKVALSKDYTLSINADGADLLNITKEKVALSFDNRAIAFGTEGLSYADADRSFDFSKGGVSLTESGNTLSLTRELEFNLVTADSKSLKINTSGAKLSYDKYEIGFDKVAGLSYADGNRSLAFGGEGIQITEGDFELGFTKDNRLTLSNGSSQQLAIDANGLEVTFDDKQFAIGKEVGLKYADNDRSFELGKTGLEVAFEDYLIKAKSISGKPAIEMVKGENAFTYSDGQASFVQGANSLLLGGDNYFALDYDGKLIKGSASAISYQEKDLLIAFGGEENFIELAQGNRSLMVTKTKELVLQEDQMRILVAADQRLEMTDGSRTFKLGGDDIVSYSEGSDSYRLFSPSTGVFGVGITQGDYGLALTGGKTTPAAFTVNSPYGDLTLSSDQQSNVGLSYGGNTLKTGKQGISWESADGSGPAEAEPEQLASAAHVDYSGPQYLGDKLTSSSGGMAKGSVQMYYNSGEQHFIANAAMASVIPPCLSGAMAIEASPKTYRIDIGTETQRIEVYPSCSGFGGGGWLNITPSELGVGVFVGWKAGGTVDIGVAEITAKAGAELGIRAKMQLEPFKIKEAGIWVLVYAEISVDPAIGSKFTIAEASLEGTLTMYFEDKTRVKGTLDGYINVCGIKGGFDMEFNTTF